MRFGVLAAAAAVLMASPASAATTLITFEPGTPTMALLPDGNRASIFEPDNQIVPYGDGYALLATSEGLAKDVFVRYGTRQGPFGPNSRYSISIKSFDIISEQGAQLWGTVFGFSGGHRVLDPGILYCFSFFGSGDANFAVRDFSARFSVRGTAYIDNVVTESGFAVVPEPSMWTLILLGFGTVGAAIRRKKSSEMQVRFSLGQ